MSSGICSIVDSLSERLVSDVRSPVPAHELVPGHVSAEIAIAILNRLYRRQIELVDRPADFDLANFGRSLLRFSCRVRLSPNGWRRLPDAVGVEASRVVPGPPDSAGWMDVELRLESPEVALSQLIGLGADVEVLEPLSLRDAVCAVAEQMAARHQRNGR